MRQRPGYDRQQGKRCEVHQSNDNGRSNSELRTASEDLRATVRRFVTKRATYRHDPTDVYAILIGRDVALAARLLYVAGFTLNSFGFDLPEKRS